MHPTGGGKRDARNARVAATVRSTSNDRRGGAQLRRRARPPARARARRGRALPRRRSIARWQRSGCSASRCPEALGGAGADTLAYAVVMEELARGYASVADQCGLVELVGHAARRARHRRAAASATCARCCAAERRCAYALTEAEAGSDLSNLRTTAMRTRPTAGRSPARSSGSTTHRCATSRACSRAPIRRRAIAGMSIFLVDRDLAGFQRRAQGAQDGAARFAGRRAAVRRRGAAGAMRCSAPRVAAFT